MTSELVFNLVFFGIPAAVLFFFIGWMIKEEL